MPLISFTFDDFPLSALEVGGKILRQHGVAGTYYVSLGLLDREESVGRICSVVHLKEVLSQGHELGCHTFNHCDAWDTEPESFERSIVENQRALVSLMPGSIFETMSYPISTTPRPTTKEQTGLHFSCCRAGGQSNNVGSVDLNYVRSFFLEQSKDDPGKIFDLIERNRLANGWLIFSTHDVTDRPSRYGCTPRLFRDVVSRAVGSNTLVLPVSAALKEVLGGARNGHDLFDDSFRPGGFST
ncbi:MAG: polysaccharide deacetylase family protein [Nitrospira sp.]|nr:polysaccharide deacetylase family protein [Nitrospira sp.]